MVQFDSYESLVAALREEATKRRHGQKVLAWTLGGGIGLLLALYVAVYFVKGRWPDDPLTGVGSIVVFLGAAMAFSTRHKQALAAAAERADPRLAGFLLEAAFSDERDVRGPAEEALKRALPLLTPEHADEVSPHDRGLLLRTLSTKRPTALVQGALDAVQSLCGAESVPALEAFGAKASGAWAHWDPLADKASTVLGTVRLARAREIIEASPPNQDNQVELRARN